MNDKNQILTLNREELVVYNHLFYRLHEKLLGFANEINLVLGAKMEKDYPKIIVFLIVKSC